VLVEEIKTNWALTKIDYVDQEKRKRIMLSGYELERQLGYMNLYKEAHNT
jgi:hypothetical protein